MSSKRPVTPGSRFAEGSMNDRTSAAPPPHFLGPDVRDASTRSSASLPNFPNHSDGGDCAAPTTTHDGPQQRLTRPRSVGGSEKKGLSGFWEGLRGKIWGGRKQQQQQQRPVSLDAGVAAAAAVAEATLQNAGDGAPRPTREEMMASYNELMESGFFEARAIRGTRQPPPAGQMHGAPPSHGQAYARPRLETIYSPPRMVPAPASTTTPGRADDPATTPDSRGKKRAHDAEAGEERTVRKLRRTTRSITELHSRLRRAREESHPPVSYPGSASASGGRRSFSGSGGARLAKRNAARPTSSGKGAERVRISAPVTPVVKLAPGVFDAMRAVPPGPAGAGGSMRLRKRQGDASLRARTVGEAPWGGEGAVARPGGDAAVQESANWVSFANPGQEATSPRHHQQRQGSTSPRKKEPLCVVPDANRGIPSVPAIPAHFKAPAGGVDTEMENGGLRTFYAGDSFAEDILLPRESLVR
ncbi:uncharacterized protein DNG_06077 [Cephalotrichum gorgonifer]|uniref:Uncharacterized protein n=1 Tax=Cephalotrichum gorgonifer TaxID=2041049 RepID=A0AAE8N0T5_9PEZI|nr:uncharacterized protein DNG_06077 [Cephalotrichum gorgonifer]